MSTVPILCRVRALYSFKSNDDSSLQFEQGDHIEVLNQLKSGWWDGWCNGSRGWFPSNYVQVIEEYTNTNVVESSTIIDNTNQHGVYGNLAPRSALPLPRVPKSNTFLQQTQDSRLSFSYHSALDINLQQQPLLPANWIMEKIKGSTDCYYYNKLTGEMRTSPPIVSSSKSNSSLYNNNNDSGFIKDINNTYTFDDDNDNSDNISNNIYSNNDGYYSNQESLDDDRYDFYSVTSRLDGNISSNATESNNTLLYDAEVSTMLPSDWVQRTNHQGRTYYCNLQTQETTWDINTIDHLTGMLLTDHPSTNSTRNSNHSKKDLSSSNTAVNTISRKIITNEPLTWHIISTHITTVINDLNQATKHREKSRFSKLTNVVIDSIRYMLLASGTIDKDSRFMRSNTTLRGHHRAMMAAMSKFMFTSFLVSDDDFGDLNRLVAETNDLLVTVRNFVGTCQDLSVPVEHPDPKLVQHGDQDESKQPLHQQKPERTKYALQQDLADNLDIYGTNMHESVDIILFSIRSTRHDQRKPMTRTLRFQFGNTMFTQFRNLSSQTGQFLGLVDDIDFGAVEDSPLMYDLLLNKQALSDGLGQIFCHLQQLTNQHLPLNQVLLNVEHAAESIHNPIRNICELISVMVHGIDITARPSLDTTNGDTVISTRRLSDSNPGIQSKPFTNLDYNCHNDHVEDVYYDDYGKRADDDDDDDINDDDDDDHTAYMRDSIFSGGNFTHTGTELTAPSTVASSNTIGSKYFDRHSSSAYLKTTPYGNQAPSDSLANATSLQSTTSTTDTIIEATSHQEKQQGESNDELDPINGTPDSRPPLASLQDMDGSKSSHKLKKFFGDDVLPSDIVTTKTATSDRPKYLSYDYDTNDISFNMEGNVKGGTLAALVERLTLHDYLDMNFNNTFLLTYRSFCTSTELLDLLEARYNLTPPCDISDNDMEIWRQKKLKLVRLRVFNVLKNWLEVYYNEEDQIILDRLMKFTDNNIRTTLSFSTDQLERLIQKRKEGTEMDVGGLKKLVWTPLSIPQSILPRSTKKFKLLDLDPTELARQLTIMDFKMYSSIRPIECLDKSWSRETTDDNAPTAINIRASIEYCNQITSWVSDAILSQNDIKKRSILIKFWVQVAERCRELNNFNTCMAILSAFDNSSVGRLKRTWENVGTRTNQTLSHIRKIMGANRNFSEYRQLIHSVNPPCIPFLGIYLQDLTFIEDGNSNIIKKSKDLINFAKREKTAEVIREIQQYQTLFYKLKTVDEIQSFIRENLQSTRDEDQLYKESLKLEPR
ncbi:ras guanine nucleotide exchange factor domain-containing protein [Chlamydoabsidia padenii]|nr:ras guanine nucleotide exchange factor domain-containing protein [Chlamydoabsidia padenii]